MGEYREFEPYVEGEDYDDYNDADAPEDPNGGAQPGLLDDDDDEYDNTEEVSPRLLSLIA